MKQEIDCGVIRDLLPLYEDGAASEESQELVRTHLKDCPACREELRKMRTPISLPPDEDEEAVKRYLARQAELRRKENRRLAMIGIPLVAVLVFCLCYALIPRSWRGVSGGVEPDWIMGGNTEFTFRDGTAVLDCWTLNREDDPEAEAASEIMNALRDASYRAELGNLLNYTPFGAWRDLSVEGLGGSVNLSLVKDNEIIARVELFDMRKDCEVHIGPKGKPFAFTYHTDKEVFEQIAALMQEYGEFQG